MNNRGAPVATHKKFQITLSTNNFSITNLYLIPHHACHRWLEVSKANIPHSLPASQKHKNCITLWKINEILHLS